MSFRSIVRDVRNGIGSISRRGFEAILSGSHPCGKSLSSVHQFQDNTFVVIQHGHWASLPPELLRDVIKRLEQNDGAWPSRRSVVACAGVCRAWRVMCKEIVSTPEFSGKLTFPISLKQPGPREETIQCFIKRDKSSLTYRLFLSLTPSNADNGKFLLSAKRSRRTTYTEYVISMSADNISRSSNTYIGKLRSNFLGTKFIIYDTQPPHTVHLPPLLLPSSSGRLTSRRFTSSKVSPKLPQSSFPVARVTYELNVLGTRGPRRMHCTMHTIPASSVAPGGAVPGQPESLIPPRSLEESFNSSIFSKSGDFSSSRFFDDDDEDGNDNVPPTGPPLMLRNKTPRWHEQLQCWCLNFRGRVTVASVKNFQLIADVQTQTTGTDTGTTTGTAGTEQEKIILQFGKVGKDMFTMDYRYPLSAFQAFAICLTSFDTKLACE